MPDRTNSLPSSPIWCRGPARSGRKPRRRPTSRITCAHPAWTIEVWDLDEACGPAERRRQRRALCRTAERGRDTPGRGGGRSLILTATSTSSSPEPVEAWSTIPGRPRSSATACTGAAPYDMKSGDRHQHVAAPAAARSRHRAGRAISSIHSVIEEECSGNGALDAARRVPRGCRGHHRADRRPLHPRPRRRALVPHRHHRQVVARHAGLARRQRHHQGRSPSCRRCRPSTPSERDGPPDWAGSSTRSISTSASSRAATGRAPSRRLRAALPRQLLPRPDRRARRGARSRRRSRRPRADDPWFARASAAHHLGRVPERRRRRIPGRCAARCRRLNEWHERVTGAPMRTGRQPASTTCATTTSPASRAAATARPAATRTAPTSGSIYLGRCRRRRCLAHSCSTGAAGRVIA